jgi:hypothetical protein
MSMRADHVSIAQRPLWRRQQFWRVALPVLAVAAAIVAGLLVYNAFVGSKGVAESKHGWGITYKAPPTPKTVKLAPAETAVARKFIQTAVARKNLAASYAIVGPGLREGMTRRQWLTGDIPVVPYVVTDATSARMAVDQSYSTSAKLEVYIKTPGQRGHIFFLDLLKRNGHWLVNSWVPRGSPPIPNKQ